MNGMITRIAAAIGLSIFGTAPLNAADAVFSADGKSVHALPWRDLTGAWQIDVASGKAKLTPFPKTMGEVTVLGIARDKVGSLLLATSKTVWSWDTRKNTAAKRVEMPAESFWDVAVHAGTGDLLMDPRDFGMPFVAASGWRTAGRMFARRADGASKFAFADDHTAFFAVGGDLWAGDLYWWDKSENEVPKQVADQAEADEHAHAFGTEAARMVALGVLQSNSSNQRNVTIDAIAASRERLYIWLGNRDSGELISLPLAPMIAARKNGASQTISDVASFLQLSGSLIQQTKFYSKTVGFSGKHPWLCASPDHRHIFVRGQDDDGQALFLITDDGEPRKLATFEGDE